jgi:hypothetical protein
MLANVLTAGRESRRQDAGAPKAVASHDGAFRKIVTIKFIERVNE